jgi:hypothetical protein
MRTGSKHALTIVRYLNRCTSSARKTDCGRAKLEKNLSATSSDGADSCKRRYGG